jgi:predicted ATP-grasp superfamily ATP-dependent carboligase
VSKYTEKLLIIANSARMLAQAARNSGFIPYVIDCYADQDTQQLAENYQKVPSLSWTDLSSVVGYFKQQYGITRLIYGSGFESHSESLVFLAQYFEILGNSLGVFIALQNKRDFFQRLQQLNINHPKVSFSFPKHSDSWLTKPQDSQGGLNIRWAKKPAHPTNFYYQRYLKGQSLSVLFLANGKQARIIGFNQQLTTSFDNQPFVFAGIINHAELSLEQQQTLANWVNKLTQSYGLHGLNSLDFILSENVCYVLEINPRPPASMQLYDSDLLRWHIDSQDLSGFKNLEGLHHSYKAYQILYAQKTIQIPEQMQWSGGCVDLPSAGAIISKGQPICSIIASGEDLAQLLNALHLKKSLLSTIITTEHDAIQSQR